MWNMALRENVKVSTRYLFRLSNLKYRILPVNSHGYYKFQVEIGAATNQDFYIEIARKA